jgi:hypothetical protein
VHISSFLQILLNFRTAYIDPSNNKLVTNRRLIAHSYLTHWFTIDTVSVLPFQAIMMSDSLGLVRLLKGARVWLQLLFACTFSILAFPIRLTAEHDLHNLSSNFLSPATPAFFRCVNQDASACTEYILADSAPLICG